MDIIIGAGATGLAYASFTTNDYLVIEADCEVGGYCKTIKQDGFVWDYSGHFFHFRRPDLEQYICQYIKPDTILKCHKHTQILYKGKYIDFHFKRIFINWRKKNLLIVYMTYLIINILVVPIFVRCCIQNLGKV